MKSVNLPRSSPWLKLVCAGVATLLTVCVVVVLMAILYPASALVSDVQAGPIFGFAQSWLLTSGGPDAFGYTFKDSNEPDGPTYAWEEISSTGTQVTGWTSTDDGYAGPIPIGFDFNYYGNNYDELYVGSNGYLSFGQGYGTIPGGSPPQTWDPNNDVALFGGDMYLYNYGSDSVVYYQTLSSPTRFVLEFVNLYYCCGQNTPHTFEVILYPNGDVLAQYQSLNGTSTDYVGIENADGTDGLSYGATLSDSLTIRYYYPVGVFLTPTAQSGFGEAGSTVTYTMWLANQTDATDSFTLTIQPGNTWTTTLSLTQTGTLSDGDSLPFTVWVEIPPSASPGEVDSVTLQATSVASPTIFSDTATISTTAIGGDLAYVTLSNDDLVALVDTASHTVLGSVAVGAAGCDFPWRATMSPDGGHVYVACRYSNNVAVIETTGNTVVTTIDNIPSADGIAFIRDGAYALVGSRHDSQITVVDTATHFASTISTSSNVRSIAAHPYLDTAYATSGDGNVLVIDTMTFNIATAIPVGDDPWDVAVSPDGQWVFAGSRRGDGLAVIDAGSNTLHTTVTGLGDLTGLDVAPDGSAIYAASLWDGVHVVDGVTFNHTTTITDVGRAWEVAVTCDGSELYVGNTENQVPVIDTATLWQTQIAMPGSGARGTVICPQHVATGVFLSPAAQTNQGGRGQVVAHDGRLINATGATDSFSLTLGSHVWDTALSTDSLGPIANGDSAAFTVYVTVPVGIGWYSTDVVEVSATSVASPTVYSDTATFTTEAYAPPEIGVSPDVLTSTQYVNEIVTKPLTISNGSGVTLTFEIGTGSGVSFFAASTQLYGYDVPDAWLRIVGTQDDTHVQVINLDTGAVIDENTDLDCYGIWDVYPNDGTFYKVEADRPVVGYESDLDSDWNPASHNTFVPSLDSGPVGTEFIFFYTRADSPPIPFYVFAVENANVKVYDTSSSLVASRTMSAGEYWDLSLSSAVYHVVSTGRIAMEIAGGDGYTTVPSVEGNGIGRRFYFVTDGSFTGAFVVFAYQDADVDAYDLDSGSLLYSQHVNQGDYWWQTGVGTRRLRLESTGKVEVWGGDAENGNQIENLGDDLSFAGGDDSREYYLHSLMDGSVIFALFDNTQVDVDSTVYNLNKDEYLHLDGCCYFRHIQSNQPILIQTLGRDSWWNNLGTYLGGVLAGGGGLPPWLTADPISGTVSTDSSTPVRITFDATNLQPGDYTVATVVKSNDPVTPSVSVSTTMTVLPTANMGWVEGTVTDIETGDPLEATVVAWGQPYTVTTDPGTGAYKLWLGEGNYTIQVAAAGYVSETAAVSITAQQGVTQNFGLVLNVPVLEVAPESLEVTHYVGDVTTREMTITNNGPAPLTFELHESDAGFSPRTAYAWRLAAQVDTASPAELNQPPAFTTAYVTLSDYNLVALVDTTSHTEIGTVNVGAAGCEHPWRAAMSPDGDYVYVGCRNSGTVAVIETTGNTVVTTVGGIHGADGIAFTRDGAYALVGSRWSSQVAVVDTATYSITTYINTPSDARSIAAHPYLDVAYATSTDGTIQVIDTTTFSITASVSVGDDPHDVAVSADGQWVFAGSRRGDGLAVIDADSNTLHTTVTGTGTVHFLGDLTGLEVAPDGSAVYACGMWSGVHVIDGAGFDHVTTIPGVGDTWEAAVTCDGSELYVGNKGNQVPVIDTAILSVTEHIPISGSDVHGIAICPQHVARDVPWLSEDPVTGTVPGYSSTPVQVTFDATGVQPGVHAAEIMVRSNDPVTPTASVPVTMTVEPTPDMGRVSGVVSDAWTDLPLEATVELIGVHSMTASPDYTIWAAAGTYSLTAYTSGYVTATRSVIISAGGVVTENLALEPAQPRLELETDVVSATAGEGGAVNRTLVISNTGPLPLDVALYEISPTVALRTMSPLSPADLTGKRILYDRVHDEPDSSEYSSLINDAISAGAVITENWYTIEAAVLEGYDVLWVNCCGYTTWSFGELNAVSDWLDQGGALFVQGESSDATDGAASVFGINYESGSCDSGTTTDIGDHPISEGVDAVNVEWTCWRLAPSVGADIVVFDTQGQPHVVAQEQNGGKMVVVASEDFIDWHINNDDNRTLANNILAWLARPSYSDVSWLSEMPQAATIPGHSGLPATLTFDATALSQGDYQATLAIEHNDPAQSSPVELPVTLSVVAPQVALSLTPALQERSGVPGETVVYTFTVTNEGNSNDTFSLNASGVWMSTLSADTTGALGVQESFVFTLGVDIPSTATYGISDTTTITARSTLDPGASESVQAVTTAVSAYRIYLPLVIRDSP